MTAEPLSEPLFPDDGLRVVPEAPEEDDRGPGQKLRDRQAARIGAGLHPLSLRGSYIRLHPAAPHDAAKDDGGTYPRCGDCAWRTLLDHHNRTYPKCLVGWDGRRVSTAPRYSAGEASDVRAWWPGCRDWAPRTEGPA